MKTNYIYALALILMCAAGYSQDQAAIRRATIEAIETKLPDIQTVILRAINDSKIEPVDASKPTKITPMRVDQLTFNNDTPKTIIKQEVKDFYYETTYFDSAGQLKIHYLHITHDTPRTAVLVDETVYNRDAKSIVKAEIKDNHFSITYFDGSQILKTYNSPISEDGRITTSYSSCNNFSIMTVPVKIRPATGNVPSFTKGDVDNVGLYWEIYGYKWERWYYDDTTTTFKIGIGPYFAPSFEELTKDNTSGLRADITKTNQCYLTSAVAITFSFNKINIAVIPIGADTGFSGTSKSWIYNGNFWWGFGIGIDTSLFSF